MHAASERFALKVLLESIVCVDARCGYQPLVRGDLMCLVIAKQFGVNTLQTIGQL